MHKALPWPTSSEAIKATRRNAYDNDTLRITSQWWHVLSTGFELVNASLLQGCWCHGICKAWLLCWSDVGLTMLVWCLAHYTGLMLDSLCWSDVWLTILVWYWTHYAGLMLDSLCWSDVGLTMLVWCWAHYASLMLGSLWWSDVGFTMLVWCWAHYADLMLGSLC